MFVVKGCLGRWPFYCLYDGWWLREHRRLSSTREKGMNWLWGFSAVGLAYMAGSVPVAYLASRWMRDVDTRAVGS